VLGFFLSSCAWDHATDTASDGVVTRCWAGWSASPFEPRPPLAISALNATSSRTWHRILRTGGALPALLSRGAKVVEDFRERIPSEPVTLAFKGVGTRLWLGLGPPPKT